MKEKVFELIKMLGVSDTKTIGRVMLAWGIWSTENSATVNSHKALVKLSELNKIERCNGFWRLNSKSEYGDHAKAITEKLADIVIQYPQSIIYREHEIKEVGLRPDALILKVDGNKGKCEILEVRINEPDRYYKQKVNTWNQWQGATEYLSSLFGFRIKSFKIVEVH